MRCVGSADSVQVCCPEQQGSTGRASRRRPTWTALATNISRKVDKTTLKCVCTDSMWQGRDISDWEDAVGDLELGSCACAAAAARTASASTAEMRIDVDQVLL